MKVYEARARLDKALKRLDGGQGRIARRNARQAVLGALRKLKCAMNEEYPVLRKQRVERQASNTAPLTEAQKKAREERLCRRRRLALTTQGYAPCKDGVRLALAAQAGIRAKADRNGNLWLPKWIFAAANLSEVVKAKKDRVHRHALASRAYFADEANNG